MAVPVTVINWLPGILAFSCEFIYYEFGQSYEFVVAQLFKFLCTYEIVWLYLDFCSELISFLGQLKVETGPAVNNFQLIVVAA